MAHVCGDKVGANRHDPTQTVTERDDYQNLILLCPTHHTLIDRKENETVYTVAALQEMKATHEARVLERLGQGNVLTKVELARMLLPLLEENRQSWAQYGPQSDLARTQPHNEAARSVWVSERLSVIVPNNRIIVTQLKGEIALFDATEQAIVAAFLMHARSYERWVKDVIPYSAVRRFPLEFDHLVRGLTDDGA